MTAGPRVSDRQPYAGAVLRSYAYHRMEVVRRLANQCVALQDELASLRAQNERLREAGSRLAAAVDALSRHHAAKYHVMDSLDMKRWSDVNDGQVAWDRALASTDTGETP